MVVLKSMQNSNVSKCLWRPFRAAIFLSLCTFFSGQALAHHTYASHPAAQKFMDKMVTEHGFDRAYLKAIFREAKRQEKVKKSIAKPAEKELTWASYRKIFVHDRNIAGGLKFMQSYETTLKRAEKEFGVPAEVITAIIGVETRYGSIMGKYRLIDSLSTLAFDTSRRAKFFTGELESLFLLAREQKLDVKELKGSYAGAMGFGQFIPSSYRHFAIDFDGDEVADILTNPYDAIGSVANYFAKHKWQPGNPVVFSSPFAGKDDSPAFSEGLKPKQTLQELTGFGVSVPEGLDLEQKGRLLALKGEQGLEHWLTLHNFYVITRYNHSSLYAMAVHQLSQEIAKAYEASQSPQLSAKLEESVARAGIFAPNEAKTHAKREFMFDK